MATINQTSLQNLLSSGYTQEEPKRSIGPINIYRYVLSNSDSPEIVSKAATAIRALMQKNPHLIATFPTASKEELQETVRKDPYLVINGRAVCLSHRPKAPKNVDRLCVDALFSEALLSEPVQCERGTHTFEKRYIEIWKNQVGDFCPAGQNQGIPHAIGPIHVDPYLEDRVKHLTETAEKASQEFKEASEEKERDRVKNNIKLLKLENRVGYLEGKKTHDLVKVGSGVGKVTLKIALVAAAKHSGKTTAQVVGKRVPILSAVIGCGLAYNRYQNGENEKAALELASGALSTMFPGPGTLASVAIDAGLLAHDVHEIYNRSEVSEGEVSINLTVEQAHEMLKLNPNESATKKEIDDAFRSLSLKCHPDKMKRDFNIDEEDYAEAQQILSSCRDALYAHYGYN